MRLRRLRSTAEQVEATAVPVWPSRDPAGRPHPAVPHADPQLPCAGCAHSAAAEPFPGMPSGERPCGFCVRNPAIDDDHPSLEWFGDRGPVWYDGETPPFKTPMDCYIATDRLTQQRIFDELDRLKRDGVEAPPRERFDSHGPETWCCDGGSAPGGHTWTCWRWLGISFG